MMNWSFSNHKMSNSGSSKQDIKARAKLDLDETLFKALAGQFGFYFFLHWRRRIYNLECSLYYIDYCRNFFFSIFWQKQQQVSDGSTSIARSVRCCGLWGVQCSYACGHSLGLAWCWQRIVVRSGLRRYDFLFEFDLSFQKKLTWNDSFRNRLSKMALKKSVSNSEGPWKSWLKLFVSFLLINIDSLEALVSRSFLILERFQALNFQCEPRNERLALWCFVKAWSGAICSEKL